MKRRDFLIGAAGLAAGAFPALVHGQSTPSAQGQSPGGSGSAEAEADWIARSTGKGVVWCHDFRSDAEVNNFRWSSGIGGGNDPQGESRVAQHCRRITDDGVTGGGCLELFRPAGRTEISAWWRPFSPLKSPGNGKPEDDPGAGGTIAPRPYNPTQRSSAIANHRQGFYGHASYHKQNFDGDEFYLQMRVKNDPRRASPGMPSVGKLSYLTTCRRSLSAQEIVTYSGAVSRGRNYFRMYGGWRVFAPLDDEVRPRQGIQPGNEGEDWYYSDGWDTLMYHFVMGRKGVDETLIEVFAAHPGETEFRRIWRQTFAFHDFDTENGLQALLFNAYQNGQSCPQPFFNRFDQIIFSKEFIPCPRV